MIHRPIGIPAAILLSFVMLNACAYTHYGINADGGLYGTGYSNGLVNIERADDGREIRYYSVEYSFHHRSWPPFWEYKVSRKRLSINVFYRCAELTKELGKQVFLFTALPIMNEMPLDPDTPVRPQEFAREGDQLVGATLRASIVAFDGREQGEAFARKRALVHRVVYSADEILEELAPFIHRR